MYHAKRRISKQKRNTFRFKKTTMYENLLISNSLVWAPCSRWNLFAYKSILLWLVCLFIFSILIFRLFIQYFVSLNYLPYVMVQISYFAWLDRLWLVGPFFLLFFFYFLFNYFFLNLYNQRIFKLNHIYTNLNKILINRFYMKLRKT